MPLSRAQTSLASPSAIGSTTPNTGDFTTLKATQEIGIGANVNIAGAASLHIDGAGIFGQAGIEINNSDYGKWLIYAGVGSQDAIGIFSYTLSSDVFCFLADPVSENGFMGIFNSSPTKTLDVNGEIKCSNYLNILDSNSEVLGIFKSDSLLSADRTYDLPDQSGTMLLDTLNKTTATAPTANNSSGITGEIRKDSNYIYVCTATDTWKRVAISTW